MNETKKKVAAAFGIGLLSYGLYRLAKGPKEEEEGPAGALPAATVELSIYETDTGRLVVGYGYIGDLPPSGNVEPGVSYTAKATVTNTSTWRGSPISYPFSVEFNVAAGAISLPQQGKATGRIEPNIPTPVSFDFTLTNDFAYSTVTFSAKVKTLAGVLVVTGTKTASCMYLVDLGLVTLTAQVRGTVVVESANPALPSWIITAPDESYKIVIPLKNNYTVSKAFTISALAEYYRPGPVLDSSVILHTGYTLTLGAGLTTNTGALFIPIYVPLACSGGFVVITVYVYDGATFIQSKQSTFNAEAISPGATVIIS